MFIFKINIFDSPNLQIFYDDNNAILTGTKTGNAHYNQQNPDVQCKAKKSKYDSHLWDKLPLHKEPKRKRTASETEVRQNYKNMLEKTKRKYKQRKSKYDPELWDNIPLRRQSNKAIRMKLECNSGVSDHIDDETNDSFGEEEVNDVSDERRGTDGIKLTSTVNANKNRFGASFRNNFQHGGLSQCIKDKAKIITRKHKRIMNSSGKRDSEITILQNFETIETKYELGNVLFVQKILDLLSSGINHQTKLHMAKMLKTDEALKEISLEEISRRCGFRTVDHGFDRQLSMIRLYGELVDKETHVTKEMVDQTYLRQRFEGIKFIF